ncbi:hypothetical protein R3P38DRAFT_3236711 [Favolaschia claudopus]|uniref:J domain-containing protein n=1 Tax=Favolaschia claudopus TaxID=2862362 RepID=A0AAV9ZBT7_9AGAR
MTDSSPLPSSSPLPLPPLLPLQPPRLPRNRVASGHPHPYVSNLSIVFTLTYILVAAGNRTSRCRASRAREEGFDFRSLVYGCRFRSAVQQKAKVLLSYFHKYLERGHPDSPLKPEDDGEKRARLAAAYEIAAQYFRTEYEEAQDKAEARDRTDDGPYTDSSDEDDGFVPPLPIFWFGGHPYPPRAE